MYTSVDDGQRGRCGRGLTTNGLARRVIDEPSNRLSELVVSIVAKGYEHHEIVPEFTLGL
jgi:hypothetical protein